jgi:hypothetical protein
VQLRNELQREQSIRNRVEEEEAFPSITWIKSKKNSSTNGCFICIGGIADLCFLSVHAERQ